MVVSSKWTAAGASVLRVWTEIHEASLDRARRTLDPMPAIVLVTTALVLTMQRYVGGRAGFERVAEAWSLDLGAYGELWSFAWWGGWCVIGYLVVPMLVVACVPGQRVAEYGWSFVGFERHLWRYALMYLLVLPLVVSVAHTEAFRATYPFYRQAHRSAFDLVAWELIYAAQFLSLEFFFRGFMLHGLKRSMGVHAIWVMVVPYCMIHFGKPVAETLGAIVAGVILGTVALRTGSIWGGVAVHVGVALTMDLLTVSMLR